MDVRLTWTDCDETGDYVVPNVLSPRDIVFRSDNMDKTVLHTSFQKKKQAFIIKNNYSYTVLDSFCVNTGMQTAANLGL